MEDLLDQMDLFTVFCFLFLYALIRSVSKPRDFPPGPRNFPIVGGLLSFTRHSSPFHALKALVDQHGEICGLFFGSKKVVIIANYTILKGEKKFYEIYSLVF